MSRRRAFPLALVVAGLTAVLGTSADPDALEPDVRLTPDQVLAMIAADLKTLTPDQAAGARYLCLRMGRTRAERDDLARLGVATLNDLSGSRVPTPLIGPDAGQFALSAVLVDERLVRFDARVLGKTFAAAWERLGAVEPYWHVTALVETGGKVKREYGNWYDAAGVAHKEAGPGRAWRTTEVREEGTDKRVTSRRGLVFRTDVGKAALVEILQRMVDPTTGLRGTDVPVVDVDWFVGQTLKDLTAPGYSDFLGFDDLKGWKKLAGVVDDPKLIDASFLSELREAVAGPTEVANPNVTRRVIHLNSVGGDCWFTNDANHQDLEFDPDSDALTNLVDLPKPFRFQAIEALAHKANGYVLKGLFNSKGAKQKVAPSNIASDSSAPHTDRDVHVGLCFRCHCKAKRRGFQPLGGWARNVANSGGNLLGSKDPKIRARLFEQYVSERLEPYLDRSRDRYAGALFRTTGWQPEEYSEAVTWVWKRHVDGPVDADLAARRLGVKTADLQDVLVAGALRRQLKAKGATEAAIDEAALAETARHHPLLAAFRPDGKGDGGDAKIPAVLWQQQVFQRAADAVHGTARPYSVKELKGAE